MTSYPYRRRMRRSLLAAALSITIALAGCTAGARPAGRPPANPPANPPSVTGAGAGGSTPVADPIYPRRGTGSLDVLHYRLDLEWTPKTRILRGTATLRIRPTADQAELRLDFMPYRLESVTVDGATRPGRVSAEKLVVPAALVKDRPVTLEVRYSGTPRTTPAPSKRSDIAPLGLTVTADGGLWTMQEPFGAFTWYPVNDHPSDKALYDMAVNVPAGWSAVASGTPAGTTATTGGAGREPGTTFRYRSTDPVASYLTTLAVGRYRKETATGPHGLPLTYWYRPGTDDQLVPVLRKSPQFIAWLEERFGPYPFPTAGVVVVPAFSAMETQQMVTMGGGYDWSDSLDLFEINLFHEYAHHWFGDTVTLSTWRDLWLNEGWATYAQYLLRAEREKWTKAEVEKRLRSSDARHRAQHGPPGQPGANTFGSPNVYLCTAAMLHELRDALGDAGFFALARDWVQQNRNSQQDRASFIAFVNKQTGRDFTQMINTWLDSRTTPR